MASERILTLKDADFSRVISEMTGPILIDFWADWCGPCKMIAPVVEEIASEYEGKVRVAKINVDENRDTPASLKVQSIPTLIVFKDGQEVDRYIGFKTKDELKRLLSKHI